MKTNPSVLFNSLRHHGLYSLWNSPGENTGVGSISLLQGIPSQGLKPGFLHCRQILYLLSHKGIPVVKNLHPNAEDIRNVGLIPGLGRSPGGGHDNPLQYSSLENSMDRGAWRTMVQRVAQSQTQLKQPSMHTLRTRSSTS